MKHPDENHLSVLSIEFFRLPIVQGGTFSLLAPTFAILSLDNNQCPKYFNKFGWTNVLNLTVNGASVSDEYIEKNGWENVDATLENVTNEYKAEQWQYRMQEVCKNLIQIFFITLDCSKLLLSVYNLLLLRPFLTSRAILNLRPFSRLDYWIFPRP